MTEQLTTAAGRPRHRYESGGPKGQCRVCGRVWSNPLHRQSRDALHEPLLRVSALEEAMRFWAIPALAVFADAGNGGAAEALRKCREALESDA